MNIAQLKAIDVHVHIEDAAADTAVDSATRKYFGDSGAVRNRQALTEYSDGVEQANEPN